MAVAGRSNAGKSSAINVIVNRRQFARTSKTPGRTQLVNFFTLREGQRLVDLPGYGFAKVSDAMRRHWGELLSTYFEQRTSLRGLILVVDIRRGITEFDERMLTFAESVRLPTHVLLTKADKLKRGQAATALLGVRKALGDRATVQLFSALRGVRGTAAPRRDARRAGVQGVKACDKKNPRQRAGTRPGKEAATGLGKPGCTPA